MVEVLSGYADKHTCPMKVTASEIQVEIRSSMEYRSLIYKVTK